MKHLVLTLILIAGLAFANAQGVTFSTPMGDFSMMLEGIDDNGDTTTGYLIEEIEARLETLQKTYLKKLNKKDGKKANQLVEEVYYLLSLIPEDEEVSVEGYVAEESDNTNVNTNTNSININIITSQETQSSTGGNVMPPPPPPGQYLRPAMPDGDFSDLVSRIRRESFSDDQIRVLRTAAQNHVFSCSQIVRLLDAFTFSEDKLEALRLAYPGCVDPQNNYRILDAFTYSTDKEEAEQIIRNN